MSKHVPIDSYIIDTLMRDLTQHDKSPATFLVYLYLYSATIAIAKKSTHRSLQMVAEETGLSKSAVQLALRRLLRRKLVVAKKASKTAVPEYAPLRPWIRNAQ